MKNKTQKEREEIILDLCGGTGSWSLPYKEAGFVVHNITLPDWNVKRHGFNGELLEFYAQEGSNQHLVVPVKDIYGILAAPPCTMFSFARTNAKTPRDLEAGMDTVLACLRVVWGCIAQGMESDQQKYSPLKFWALENPYHGMLKWFLGEPAYTFNPWEFGHNYQKHTALWGHFNPPIKKYTDKKQIMDSETIKKAKTNSQPFPEFDYMKSKDIHPEHYGKWDWQTRRSITPGLFAQAFFEANP
jgi:hypothetical protein